MSQPVPPYVRRQLAALILIVLRMKTDETVVETLDLIVTGPETPGVEPRMIRRRTVRPMMRVTKVAIVRGDRENADARDLDPLNGGQGVDTLGVTIMSLERLVIGIVTMRREPLVSPSTSETYISDTID